MKSALFVDFDNVYTQLRQLQPAAAERFARQPIEWMRWMTEQLSIPADHHQPDARRRLLVRRCYLNPNWYQTYRHAFLRAGFEIVDCPPVTSQGKTSTDMHMVLDIVELLAHETRYDEFIVLSADADFTPVLRKLRRYDRRTTVLAIGFPSAAYQASADLLIDERVFIEQALGLVSGLAEATSTEATAALSAMQTSAPAAALGNPPTTSATTTAGLPVSAAPLTATSPATAPWAVSALTGAPDLPTELAQIAQRIHQVVAQAPQPVAASHLASRLRQDHPQTLDNWNGLGSFKAFFRSLGLTGLVWVNGSGGRIADPQRHSIEPLAPADPEPDARWAGQANLYAVAREVCALTGAPLLPPSTLRSILALLCADLAEQPYEPTETAQRVCQACRSQRGLDLALREVVFILRGMQLNGHQFGRGQDDVATLAQRLVNQVLFLCQREQMVLTEATTHAIRQWIGGEVLAATPTPAPVLQPPAAEALAAAAEPSDRAQTAARPASAEPVL